MNPSLKLTQRRAQLIASLEEQSIVVLFAGSDIYDSLDETYPFSVNRHYYYLTNLANKNAILVLYRHRGKVQEHLLIDRYDEFMAKWVGENLMPDEASDQSGIDSILYVDEFKDTLARWINLFDQPTIHLDLHQETCHHTSLAHQFAVEIRKQYPQMIVKNIHTKMAQLRLVKSKEEVVLLEQAIAITNKGIQRMMQTVIPGMTEYQLEAEFLYALQYENCRKPSFPSIVAGGENATVLHYVENGEVLEDNALVLCDLGATYEMYHADITRTFPVNGKFTDRQKQLYEIVLAANELVIANALVGVTLRELNQLVIDFYQIELGALGLLTDGKEVRDYYFHSVSHMLGLDTHDISLPDYRLEVGNVITVEPGLYLEDEAIGIRIEDNILIAAEGPVNLSQCIVKSVDDIESLMKQRMIHIK